MKWITREHVKVDRVACPWLIKKFVDPAAEFYFVPAEQVSAEARRIGATPFDIPNVELGHHGKECSFDAILNTRSQTQPCDCSERSSMARIQITRCGSNRNLLD